MSMLDRAGIFKAVPVEWNVRRSENSQSVALCILYKITAMLNQDNGWDDWTEYEEVTIWGNHYFIKRDGSMNAATVEQLAVSLDLSNLESIAGEPPEHAEVQISVRENEYEGKVRLQVSWINPGDYTPPKRGADPGEVASLTTRYGSEFRAIAGAAIKKNGGQAATKGAGVKGAPPPALESAPDPDQPPF